MNIFPVIVIYNQKLYGTKTYLSLLKGSNLQVLVYDNSPVAMHKMSDFGREIIYKHDKDNGGVSKAYNYAASYAREHGFDWLLLLDQDTIFPEDSLSQYINAQHLNPDIRLFAPVIKHLDGRPFSPTKSFLKHANPVEKHPGRRYSLSHIVPVNTGMLVNTEAFLLVKGYDEMLPLDFSDFKFINRFATRYNLFFLVEMVCYQDFSNEEQDTDKLVKRFEMFCKSARYCKKDNFYDSICFFYVVFRRAIGLSLRTRNTIFLKKIYSHYFS